MTVEEHTHYPGRPHPCDDAEPRLAATLTHFRDAINDPSCSPSTFRAFFTTESDHPPVCVEHGPSGLAELPFLGKEFRGEEAILEYFHLIGTVFRGHGSRFEADGMMFKIREREHVHTARAVWTGEATWSVQETGNKWDEKVVWAFDLLREGRQWKIERWEVWAGMSL